MTQYNSDNDKLVTLDLLAKYNGKVQKKEWIGTLDEYNRVKDDIPADTLINITDDTAGALIKDDAISYTKSWSSSKINNVFGTYNARLDEFENDIEISEEGNVISLPEIDDTVPSLENTYSSSKIESMFTPQDISSLITFDSSVVTEYENLLAYKVGGFIWISCTIRKMNLTNAKLTNIIGTLDLSIAPSTPISCSFDIQDSSIKNEIAFIRTDGQIGVVPSSAYNNTTNTTVPVFHRLLIIYPIGI